jgi:uncharacterized membrane protein
MLIGLLNAALVIQFINSQTRTGSFFHSNAAPAIGLAVLFIPIIDTVRVMVVRIYKRKSPFVGDRNHIHHLLLKKGYSHIKVTLILAISNAFIIFYATLFRSLGITFLVFSMAMIFFIILKLFLTHHEINGFSENPIAKTSSDQILSGKIITSDGEIEASEKSL